MRDFMICFKVLSSNELCMISFKIKDQLYLSLMKWLRTFPVNVKGTEENISEGVSMAQVYWLIYLNKMTADVIYI